MSIFLDDSKPRGYDMTYMVGAHGQPVTGTAPEHARRAPVRLDMVSPSAIETFKDCQRKWAWSKLDGVPKPQGAGAELGSRVHGQKERWLRDGIPFDLTTREGEIALASLHLDPPPFSCAVEDSFTVTYDGVTFGGVIDFLPDPLLCPDYCPPGVAVVGDHKTTSALGWAKLTKEELLGHPQAPIYAVAALTKAWAQGRTDEWAELRWNYVTTRGKPRAEPSWHRVHASELPAAMAEPVRLAREMLAIVQRCNAERAAGRDFGALNLPPNTAACGKFGGCPFQSNCNLPANQSVIAMTQQMSAQEFLNRIQSRNGAAPAPVAPSAPPAAFPPAPAPAGPFVPGMPQAAPAAPQAAPPAGLTAFPFPGYGGQINPPEASVAPPAAPPPAPEAPKRGRPKKAPAAPAAPPVAVDSPQGTNLPLPAMPVDTEQMSEYERERTYQAILGGLCANPAFVAMPAPALVSRAREILSAALASSAGGA